LEFWTTVWRHAKMLVKKKKNKVSLAGGGFPYKRASLVGCLPVTAVQGGPLDIIKELKNQKRLKGVDA